MSVWLLCPGRHHAIGLEVLAARPSGPRRAQLWLAYHLERQRNAVLAQDACPRHGALGGPLLPLNGRQDYDGLGRLSLFVGTRDRP